MSSEAIVIDEDLVDLARRYRRLLAGNSARLLDAGQSIIDRAHRDKGIVAWHTAWLGSNDKLFSYVVDRSDSTTDDYLVNQLLSTLLWYFDLDDNALHKSWWNKIYDIATKNTSYYNIFLQRMLQAYDMIVLSYSNAPKEVLDFWTHQKGLDPHSTTDALRHEVQRLTGKQVAALPARKTTEPAESNLQDIVRRIAKRPRPEPFVARGDILIGDVYFATQHVAGDGNCFFYAAINALEQLYDKEQAKLSPASRQLVERLYRAAQGRPFQNNASLVAIVRQELYDFIKVTDDIRRFLRELLQGIIAPTGDQGDLRYLDEMIRSLGMGALYATLERYVKDINTYANDFLIDKFVQLYNVNLLIKPRHGTAYIKEHDQRGPFLLLVFEGNHFNNMSLTSNGNLYVDAPVARSLYGK